MRRTGEFPLGRAMPRLSRAAAAAAVAVTLSGGCTAGNEAEQLVFEHSFTGILVPPGQELQNLCASWRLDNAHPIQVNSLQMAAGPGWHHSNWFHVPEGTFSVDHGVWDCREEFDVLTAGLSGGVLFAQSTQATAETQAFLPGAAIEVPAGSVMIGQLHIINASDRELETDLSLTVRGIPAAELVTPLYPLAFDLHQLAIPPLQRSRFETTCDMSSAWGGPLELAVHYLLPHYHAFGRSMNVEMFGGDREGDPIFRVDADVGEPLGRSFTPPLSLQGASGIRFSCEYDNPTDQTIRFGNNAHSEMCILLAFTDLPVAWTGGFLRGNPTLRGVEDGVAVYEGACDVLAIPRH
jgi:hypothetical protein